MNWSDTWDYTNPETGEKVTFVRCLECKKAMPVDKKNFHQCKTQPVKQTNFKPATEAPTPINRDVYRDMLGECFEDVMNLVDKYGTIQWTSEDVRTMINTIFMQRCKR